MRIVQVAATRSMEGGQLGNQVGSLTRESNLADAFSVALHFSIAVSSDEASSVTDSSSVR